MEAAVREALRNSPLEGATLKRACAVARRMIRFNKILSPNDMGDDRRGELLLVVAWLWIVVRSGLVKSTRSLKTDKHLLNQLAQMILGEQRSAEASKQLYKWFLVPAPPVS